jgi:hypothetical protein
MTTGIGANCPLKDLIEIVAPFSLAAFTFSLMESGNDGTWSPDQIIVAISVLTAAGMAPTRAADAVRLAL